MRVTIGQVIAVIRHGRVTAMNSAGAHARDVALDRGPAPKFEPARVLRFHPVGGQRVPVSGTARRPCAARNAPGHDERS